MQDLEDPHKFKEKSNKNSKYSKEEIIDKAFRLHSQGKISEASNYYQYLINQGYGDHIIFSNYGAILQSLGKLKEAEFLYRKAIELKPDFANANANLGNILRDLGELKEAELFTRKAIQLKPDFANAHLNLGIILKDFGKLQEAELFTRKAIELRPDLANAHYNLGGILQDLGNLKEAELFTRKAIELKPNYVSAHLILSTLHFWNNNYHKGWLEYEHRFAESKEGIKPHALPNLLKWDGENLQKKEKLLVVSEQGFGDTIQFMRYIPYLKDRHFNLSFCAQIKLHKLIQSSGIDPNPLTVEDGKMITEGKWVPLLSVPRFLKVTSNDPLVNTSYIYPLSKLKKKWKNIISAERSLIIGINWQGNPKSELGNLKGRSIPLEYFSEIHKNNDYKFLSLQKGVGSEQLDNCTFKDRFVKCQSQINKIWNFEEIAAIISNCDLIITSDTYVAHLAGGIGKPTWCLLHHSPDWRWGFYGEKTFWYPSMKLFRQNKSNNWKEVFKKVNMHLKKFTDIEN